MYPFKANKMQQSQSDTAYRPAFHADNTGSNPVGDAKKYQGDRARIALSPFFVPHHIPHIFFMFLLYGESAVLPQKNISAGGGIAG